MQLARKRVAYITLGCKLNFSETSTLRHLLEEAGAVTVPEKEGADIFVINTCSVTDVAEKKGRQTIRKIIHRNPGAYIVIVGCYAQLRAEELRNMEGVSLVLGAGEKFDVVRYLEHDRASAYLPAGQGDIFSLERFDPAYSYGDRTRSFLKIQDGCDYFCTYCTIPFARGKSRSATIGEVLKTVGEAAGRNIREITLTGVNTGDFGRHTGERFIDLLRTLEAHAQIDRFRISSIEPNLLTDEIIEFVAGAKRFMPHFHLPLQSGSDEVLRLMKRRYDRALFVQKCDTIRRMIPDAFIGVDILAGMRGETETAFEDSARFVAGLDVSQLHVFPYSERAGTRALEIPLVVDPAEKRRRTERLLAISDEKKGAFYRRFAGSQRPVLWEEREEGGVISGFTDNYIRVEQPYDLSLTNRITEVTLGEESENGNMTVLRKEKE